MKQTFVTKEKVEKFTKGKPINKAYHTFFLNYNIKEKDGEYEYTRLELQPKQINYGDMVSAMVNNEYGHDKVEAILNNYMGDPSNPKYDREFRRLQEFRAYAKDLVKEILNM